VLPVVEYSVVVPVPVDEAFRTFQNLDRLLNRGIYEQAIWVEGAPWRVGSRIRYEVVHPHRATISAVVTAISPPRSVDLINHALGVAGQQHVSFGPDLKGGTRIRVTATMAGKSEDLPEAEILKLVTFLLHDALDSVLVFSTRHRAGTAPGN